MKKIISILLVVLMIASLAACGGTPDDKPDDTSDTSAEITTDETTATIEEAWLSKPSAEKYDGVFKAGFGRVDITPELPMPRKNGKEATTLDDPIYATCIAVNDGKNTALIYTVDVPNITDVKCSELKLRIQISTKVPKENIMISATHNHSSFSHGSPKDDPRVIKWSNDLNNFMVEAAKQAIADLADTEIYYGTARTPGMAFVRRRLHEDGTYSNPGTVSGLKSIAPIVGAASEADDLLQVIRFVRADKKDIVMTNWQAHLAHSVDVKPKSLTSDIAYYVRDGVEKSDDDALVAYFAAASGNIGVTAPSATQQKYKNLFALGTALANLVKETMKMENLTKLEAGEIVTTDRTYQIAVWKDSAERIAQAKEILALEEGSKEQNDLLAKYGYNSLYAPKQIADRNGSRTHYDFFISAFSFGDINFISAPYEMFDTNGMQIREASPYRANFILTCAGGAGGYVPSYEAYTIYGGYEVDNTAYACGEAEKLVAEFIAMIKENRGIS